MASDLAIPWGVLALADGSLLVGERDSGDILQVDGSERHVVRTMPIVPEGEGGMLGLAVTGDERTVFAYYTAADDNVIAAMSWDGSTLGDPVVIFSGIPKSNVHNGGGLVVGPDGLLYAGTGDARQSHSAQEPDSLSGKILRLQLDGSPAPGNPFGTAVFSYGHRNVQGLAFDGEQLWASEFGSKTWDELNMITAGGNFGWPEVEGFGDHPEMINPKAVWTTAEASPSGLAYWRGSLWMAGLRGKTLWEIPVAGDVVGKPVPHLAGTHGRLRAVTVASDDASLLVGTSNHDQRGTPAEDDDRILRLTWP